MPNKMLGIKVLKLIINSNRMLVMLVMLEPILVQMLVPIPVPMPVQMQVPTLVEPLKIKKQQ